MSLKHLTLYTNKGCPYAQRTVIALKETMIPHEEVEIDLQNKPTWYAPNINPASKVPAIAYGPSVISDPANPPEDAVKIAESLVLVEFIADIASSSDLLPKDPIQRAKARFFISLVSDKFVPAWHTFSAKGENEDAIVNAINAITKELDPEGPFALGKVWTIADTAIAPFVGRLYLFAQNDVGNWQTGAGPKLVERLQGLDRWEKYAKALQERKSFQDSFPAEHLLERTKQRYQKK